MFPKESPETYYFDNFFRDFPAQIASEENKSSEENMTCSEDKHGDINTESGKIEPSKPSDAWSLYFDGLKCKEGARAG